MEVTQLTDIKKCYDELKAVLEQSVPPSEEAKHYEKQFLPLYQDFMAAANICVICQTVDTNDESGEGAGDKKEEPSATIVLHCGHTYHQACFLDWMRSERHDPSSWPLKCGLHHGFTRDGAKIDLSTLRCSLGEEANKFIDNELAELLDEGGVYCANKHCSTYIFSHNIEGQWAKCHACSATTCTTCKGAEEEHETPDQHVQKFDEADKALASELGWKNCPNCDNLIEFAGGCIFIQYVSYAVFEYEADISLVASVVFGCAGCVSKTQQTTPPITMTNVGVSSTVKRDKNGRLPALRN